MAARERGELLRTGVSSHKGVMSTEKHQADNDGLVFQSERIYVQVGTDQILCWAWTVHHRAGSDPVKVGPGRSSWLSRNLELVPIGLLVFAMFCYVMSCSYEIGLLGLGG